MSRTSRHSSAPAVARRLLSYMLPQQHGQYILEDLERLFEKRAESTSISQARRWYWTQIIRSLPGFLLFRLEIIYAIIDRQWKIILRRFNKEKQHAILSISGLALGLFSFTLLMYWAFHELSFDSFHRQQSRIYRIISHVNIDGQSISVPRIVPGFIGNNITKFNDIEKWSILQVSPALVSVESAGQKYHGWRMISVDEQFPVVFDFPLLQGAWPEQCGVAISTAMAHKLFISQNALGRQIRIKNAVYTITGIMEDVPSTSHLQMDFILKTSAVPITSISVIRRPLFPCYVLLNPGSDKRNTETRMTDIARKQYPELNPKITLQPLHQIHLHSDHLKWDYIEGAEYFYVPMVIGTALILLAMACINHINLSRARSHVRHKEIWIREVMGTGSLTRWQDASSETAGYFALALFPALFMIFLSASAFSVLTTKPFTMTALSSELRLLIIGIPFLFFIFTSLTAALFRSGGKNLLGKVQRDRSNRKSYLKRRFRTRHVLVLLQMMLTIFTVSCTIVVQMQLHFIESSDKGYDLSNTFVIGQITDAVADKEDLIHRLRANSAIESVTRGFRPIYQKPGSLQSVWWPGKDADDNPVFQSYIIDAEYVSVFKLHILTGRNLTEQPEDSSAVLLNETAAELMALEQPAGTMIRINGQPRMVAGVVKDYHHCSMHHSIEPLILENRPRHSLAVNVRIKADQLEAGLKHVRQTLHTLLPDEPYDHTWIKDTVHAFYNQERRVAKMLWPAALISFLIAVFGCLGLILQQLQARIKEMGVRKVLGASPLSLFSLTTREILWIIVAASLTACPLAWVFTNYWLKQFYYHIQLSPLPFFCSSLLVMLGSLGAVIWHGRKHWYGNPADALRYE